MKLLIDGKGSDHEGVGVVDGDAGGNVEGEALESISVAGSDVCAAVVVVQVDVVNDAADELSVTYIYPSINVEFQ